MYRCALPALLLLAAPLPLRADGVSFRNDVMAVLSRAGCNSGACHGNLNGKGGFKLSLRGQDPAFDLDALTREAFARRVNRLSPDDSLILTKATMAAAHESGQRFSRGSGEYRLLRDWIAAGAKADGKSVPHPTKLDVTPDVAVLHDVDHVTIKVTATFSDGKKRDVTRLACFEPSSLLVKIDASGKATRQGYGESAVLVRYLDRQAVVRLAFVPARPGFVWKDVPEANFIDTHVFKKLKALRVNPSPACGDGEFIRRAYLDTLGTLPTVSETKRFLADKRSDKRTRLIDELLKRDEFADFWLKWSDLLRNEEKVLDPKGVRLFHRWIRQSFIDDKPLNQFAQELIASRGSSYSNPASNYYRALRDPYSRAEATAQVFLGVRLQCAKCHNHPFDRWTQTDYHRFGAFFARVQYRVVENNRRDKLDKHEFDGEQIVYQNRDGELKHPVSAEILKPALLGAELPTFSQRSDRLSLLADWVAKPDNPFFARAQANRIWQHLMGKGVVDPGDDFRDSNPPINPELLDALAKELVRSKFDLRHLVRTIMTSATYQLSATPNDTNGDDESNFSRALVRPLQAEQLFDAIAQVVGVRPRFYGLPGRHAAMQLPGVVAPQRRRGRGTSEGERFLSVFGKPVRSLSCECERGDDSTLAQAFQLITGETLNALLAKEDNRLGKLIDAGKSDVQILDELYLAALCRSPTEVERKAAQRLIGRGEHRSALEDVLWSLVNAKEFLLRR